MRPLWLASGSPRRRRMLVDAGFEPRRVAIDLDDDTLAEAMEGVESTCLARAWFKACAALHALSEAAEDLSHAQKTTCPARNPEEGQLQELSGDTGRGHL